MKHFSDHVAQSYEILMSAISTRTDTKMAIVCEWTLRGPSADLKLQMTVFAGHF